MKIVDFFKLKILFNKKEFENKIVKRLVTNNLFKSIFYSVFKESTEWVLELYEIRFQRYNEEDTGVFHNGFENLIEELRKSKEKYIKVHGFDGDKDEISYTIFTDTKVKRLIGILEHTNKE